MNKLQVLAVAVIFFLGSAAGVFTGTVALHYLGIYQNYNAAWARIDTESNRIDTLTKSLKKK